MTDYAGDYSYTLDGKLDDMAVINEFLSDWEIDQLRAGIYGTTPIPTIANQYSIAFSLVFMNSGYRKYNIVSDIGYDAIFNILNILIIVSFST